MIASVVGPRIGEPPQRRHGRGADRRRVEHLLEGERDVDDALRHESRPVAEGGEEIAGEQRARRLVEPEPALPVVRHVRHGQEAQPVVTRAEHLTVGHRARRPVGEAVQRDHAGELSVHHLRLRCGGRQLVHGAALVGLHAAERDPAQRLDRQHAADGLADEWEQLARAGVEQERLVVMHQELIEREAGRCRRLARPATGDRARCRPTRCPSHPCRAANCRSEQ